MNLQRTQELIFPLLAHITFNMVVWPGLKMGQEGENLRSVAGSLLATSYLSTYGDRQV